MIHHGQAIDINIQDLTMQIIGKYQTYGAIILPQQNDGSSDSSSNAAGCNDI